MPVDAVGQANQPAYPTAPTRVPKQEMDGDLFLQLMVVQLQNQDPSSPMDTNEMIAQTSQLASTQATLDMQETMAENSHLQLFSTMQTLLGREASYLNNGVLETGTVRSVTYPAAGGPPSVIIGDYAVPLDAIVSSSVPQSTDPAPAE